MVWPKIEHLKPYQWKKGQSGNPGGKKKGTKSMKVWVREYLEQLPDKERQTFLKYVDPELAWRMAEGNPHQTEDITSGGKPLPRPIYDGRSVHSNDRHRKAIRDEKENP